ncbi:hemerythrin domain-containing protein [Cryptosporangium minutisporangium]|uniref:Hemerythrin domain-containing protein n=1 Tax=Cryptosporangium minutisporangium TaxID=113569 RepID=A0ABP6SYV4_9ACTN
MPADDVDLEAVDFLVNQHAQIRAGLREVASAHGPAKAAAFADLRRLITVHETAEQLVLHPRMRDFEDADELQVDTLLVQERHGTELLAELDRLDPASDEFDARFTRLAVEIIAHADHEELEEFPLVRERLDADERLRMGRALRVAEAAAPRHPQPAAQGAVGAIVDHVRKALRDVFTSR